jgi:hypothetical protein
MTPFMNCKPTLVLTLLVLLSTAIGCSATVRKPQLEHPGPANYQRNNAVHFDPYPPNDTGPEIVGGRPPGYMVPPNIVDRARQQQSNQPWRSSASPPLIPTVPLAPPPPTGPLY